MFFIISLIWQNHICFHQEECTPFYLLYHFTFLLMTFSQANRFAIWCPLAGCSWAVIDYFHRYYFIYVNHLYWCCFLGQVRKETMVKPFTQTSDDTTCFFFLNYYVHTRLYFGSMNVCRACLLFPLNFSPFSSHICHLHASLHGNLW